MTRVLRAGVRATTWLLLAVIVAALAAAVVVPRLAGATPYTVLTGSMRPDLPPGTLVVVRRVDPATLQVGDVATFQLRSGRSTVVTHRIVEVRKGLDGRTRFVTQGDANPTADTDVRRPEQVRGELWYHVPYLGYASQALTGQQRQVGIYLVAAALLVYAGTMLLGSWRERREGPVTAGSHARRSEDSDG